MKLILALLLASAASIPTLAQKLDVKIVDRKDNETDYTYVVPGRFTANTTTNANCNGTTTTTGSLANTTVDCNGTATTNGTSVPAHEVSYHVRGATFSMLLPDGRVAVVNCESKFAERFAGPRGNHRSCRMPIVDNIKADFKGNKAKLEWVVSLDGKKTESETYKILGILDKPTENPPR